MAPDGWVKADSEAPRESGGALAAPEHTRRSKADLLQGSLRFGNRGGGALAAPEHARRSKADLLQGSLPDSLKGASGEG